MKKTHKKKITEKEGDIGNEKRKEKEDEGNNNNKKRGNEK